MINKQLGNQHLTHRQQQRGITTGLDRQPFCIVDSGQIVAHRANVNKTAAVGTQGLQPVVQGMIVGSAAINLGITQRQAADGNEQFTVCSQYRPVGVLTLKIVEIAENMRQNAFSGGDTVGIGTGGIAAKQIEEAMQLALRMMEAPGARPAVGTAIDRLITVGIFYPPQLTGHQRQRLLPTHFHKGFFTTSLTVGRLALQVAEPHRRPPYAAVALHRTRHREANLRRIAVPLNGLDGSQYSVISGHPIGAPVGHGQSFFGFGLLAHGALRDVNAWSYRQ